YCPSRTKAGFSDDKWVSVWLTSEASIVVVGRADCRSFRIAPSRRLLEPEGARLVRSAGHGVELAIEQLPVDHRVADACRIMDVVERVLVHDHEVGELAGLDRAQVMIEAVRARRVDGRGAQRLEV